MFHVCRTSNPTEICYAIDVLQIINFTYCIIINYTLVAGDNYAAQLYYIITKNIFFNNFGNNFVWLLRFNSFGKK